MHLSLEKELTDIAESLMREFVEFHGIKFQIFAVVDCTMVKSILKVSFLGKEMARNVDFIIQELMDKDCEQFDACTIKDTDNNAEYFFQLQKKLLRANTGPDRIRMRDGAEYPDDEYVLCCIISKVEHTKGHPTIPAFFKSARLWEPVEQDRTISRAKNMKFHHELK